MTGFPPLSFSNRAFHLLSAIGLGVLVGCAYADGMDIPYYADDFELYFPALDVYWADLLARTGPEIEFYRPLQNVILSRIQSAVGMNPVPIHTLTLVFHLAVVGLVYEGARWLDTSRRAALLAAITMGIAQANTAAVLGNDTLSQVGATLFGYLAVRLYGARRERDSAVCSTDAYVLAALACSFLFKEAGVAFVLPIVVIEGIDGMRTWREKAWESLYGSSIRLGGVCVLAGGYLAWRAWTGAVSPGIGEDPYQYRFGMNLVRNVGLFGAAAANGMSTTSIALWAQTGAYLKIAGALLGMGALGGVVGYGLVRGSHVPIAGGLLLLGGLSLAPVLPLNNVSELYVYAAMPPVSLLLGLGFDDFLTGLTGWNEIGGMLLIGVYFFGQAWGVYQKSSLMERTGTRTQAVLNQIVDVVQSAPRNATVCLRDKPSADTTAYSVYRMPGATPFQFAEPVIQHFAQRPDVAFEVGSSPCGSSEAEHSIVLRLQEKGRRIERIPATKSASSPRRE